jgi:hypothetical protein
MKLAALCVGLIVCVLQLTGISAREIRTPGDPSSASSTKIPKVLSVDSRGKKHGEFRMLGTGKHDCIILSNNIMYEPAHRHDAKVSENWQQGNIIRVLQTSDKKRFILLNLSTGQSMKAKILHWS